MPDEALFATISTPPAPFSVLVDSGDGSVLASGWTDDRDRLQAVVHPTLRPARVRGVRRIDKVTDAATAYHEGELSAIDVVGVHQLSGPYLVHAWDVLRTVPAGEPISYAEFASRTGRPAAIRAAASACARNAAALFVPCHRVLRTGGSLGGFRWGLPVKSWLLEHESRAGGAEPGS